MYDFWWMIYSFKWIILIHLLFFSIDRILNIFFELLISILYFMIHDLIYCTKLKRNKLSSFSVFFFSFTFERLAGDWYTKILFWYKDWYMFAPFLITTIFTTLKWRVLYKDKKCFFLKLKYWNFSLLNYSLLSNNLIFQNLRRLTHARI